MPPPQSAPSPYPLWQAVAEAIEAVREQTLAMHFVVNREAGQELRVGWNTLQGSGFVEDMHRMRVYSVQELCIEYYSTFIFFGVKKACNVCQLCPSGVPHHASLPLLPAVFIRLPVAIALPAPELFHCARGESGAPPAQ